MGFVFQSYNLIGHLNIVDNVALGLALSGVSRERKQEKALAVLEKVGLNEHVHKRPSQLSGGQMQRVAFARALANDPDVILADEPTGALDSETSRQILDLIKEIAADKLVIMVTHNRELAEAYADRIIRFQDGRVVGDSRPLAAEDSQSSCVEKDQYEFYRPEAFLKYHDKNGAPPLQPWQPALALSVLAWCWPCPTALT